MSKLLYAFGTSPENTELYKPRVANQTQNTVIQCKLLYH